MKLGKNQLLIGLLIGVLLLIVAIPTGKTGEKENYSTDMEKRLESILGDMEGVGTVKVMITTKDMGEVEGVAVIADGGDNPVVVRRITSVVEALFDVETHKIMVIKANETK